MFSDKDNDELERLKIYLEVQLERYEEIKRHYEELLREINKRKEDAYGRRKKRH